MLLSLQNVSFRYNENAIILDSASYNFNSPGIYYLIGSDGIGKSTVMNIISGAQRPDSGIVLFMAKNIYSHDAHSILNSIVLLNSQYKFIEDATVAENIQFSIAKSLYVNDIDIAHSYEVVHSMQLKNICEQTVSSISSTQRVKLALACAITRRPRIILIDNLLSCMSADLYESITSLLLEFAVMLEESGTIILIAGSNEQMINEYSKSNINLVDGELKDA